MTEFVEWLTGTHKCGCGAEYKVTVTEAPTDNVTCEKCGRRSAPAIAAARQLADRVLQFGNSGIVVRGKIVCQSITLHIQVVSKISDLLGRPTLESVSGAASSSACHPGRAAETAGTCHPRRAEAAGSPTCRYPGRAEAASKPRFAAHGSSLAAIGDSVTDPPFGEQKLGVAIHHRSAPSRFDKIGLNCRAGGVRIIRSYAPKCPGGRNGHRLGFADAGKAFLAPPFL